MLGRWFACNDVGNARWDSFRIMFLGSLGCVPASPTVVAWSETGARSCVHQSSAWSSTCSPYAHRKFGLLRFSSHRFTSVAVHTKLSLPCFRRAGFSPEVRSQWNVRKQLHDQSQLTCAKTKHFKAPSCHAEGTPGTIVLAGSSVQKPQSADVTKLSPHLETEEERPLAGRKPLAKKLEAGRQWGKAVHEEGSGRTWSDRFNGAVSSTPDADKDGVQTETVVSLDTRTPQLEASEGSTVAGAGHTLLERGTRLINTSPREGRWREARPKRHSEDAEAVVSSRSSALESRAPQSSLDAIFEQGEPGRGRQKLRFTRNPQPDVGSIDNQDAGTSSRSTAKSPIATPFLRDQVVKNGGSWRRNPSSGLLAGYETADEFETKGTGASAGAGSEWVVETCPVCHGTATLVCDVCDSGWPPGACPACKGVVRYIPKHV